MILATLDSCNSSVFSVNHGAYQSFSSKLNKFNL